MQRRVWNPCVPDCPTCALLAAQHARPWYWRLMETIGGAGLAALFW